MVERVGRIDIMFYKRCKLRRTSFVLLMSDRRMVVEKNHLEEKIDKRAVRDDVGE